VFPVTVKYRVSLFDFFFRIHDEGAARHDRLPERFSSKQDNAEVLILRFKFHRQRCSPDRTGWTTEYGAIWWGWSPTAKQNRDRVRRWGGRAARLEIDHDGRERAGDADPEFHAEDSAGGQTRYPTRLSLSRPTRSLAIGPAK